MPKELVSDSRFDFRGGLNVYLSPDLLSSNELTETLNTRIDTDGPIVKRTGSRRLHATALNAATAIKGITQWDGPSGSQIVAICNGDLFYRNQSSGEFAAFTQVDPGVTDAFSTSSPAIFSTLRGAESGAPLRLYIASGGKLYEWSGTTLLRLDGLTNINGHFAPDASLLDTYHLRLFTNSVVRPQHLVWSKLGDGRVFKGGLGTDGGTAMVSAIQADAIKAIKTVGRSLLIFTHSAIARLAGYSAADVQIDQDMEGLSPDVGIVGPLALHRAEHVLFFISDRGAYLASEAAISPIGLKVQPIFDDMDRTQLDKIVVSHHHGRNEIWVAYSGAGDSSLNKSVLVFNLRHQAWYGPFTYSFGITCMEHYEDPSGDDYIIAGCSDGFIRHLDTGAKDDVLSDGTGGSAYSQRATLAPFLFGDPGRQFALRHSFVQARNTGIDTYLTTSTTETTGLTNSVLNTTTTIKSLKNWSSPGAGHRLTLSFTNNSTNDFAIPEIHGVVVHAHDMLRV